MMTFISILSIICNKLMEAETDLTKTYFLARMSHELRTPLNAIIGMCTIAQSTTEPEKMCSCLEKINEASLHLLGMINDVLDMSKIEAGKLKLTYAELHFKQMLKKVVGTKKFTLDAKKQNLILDFDPDLPETIVSDEQRLSQVLDNFLSNAVKFTPPEGTITLSAKKLYEDDLSCSLEISVKDTGIGISKDGIKTIFTQFEQLDGGLARKYGGTGMGLAISANIVRLMGGEIQVNSELGKGSLFSFQITVEKRVKKNLAFKENEDTTQKAMFSGYSILFAEDVEINRDIVLSLLENSGLIIDCAENGLEAYEKFKAAPSKYSLILMDIHMPEMDGFESSRRIRAIEAELLERPQGVPIIAMTANVFKDDIEKCLECGMTGHLGKPVNYEELMNQLEKYLLHHKETVLCKSER